MREREFLLYHIETGGELLEEMAALAACYEEKGDTFCDRDRLYGCLRRLISYSAERGFHGNLWHCYLADIMVNHENAYSRECEVKGETEGSIGMAALHDFQIWKEWLDYSFEGILTTLHMKEMDFVFAYEVPCPKGSIYSDSIRDTICRLALRLSMAEDAQEVKSIVTKFYQSYGVGKFGLHKAFRIAGRENGVEIQPILNIANVYLDDLVGYEIPKQKLIDNTEAFLEGKRANNCLLFGDAGTGKSSSIKGILNEYYDRGLRIIEVYKHQFRELNEVIAQIKDRNYKFIIYMDDLSFEEFETEYKYLKAVIEGGLENKPDNVLIYATSNRRHLIRENFSDKEGRRDSLHSSDTVQEKLSLVYRFGVTIFFCAPDRKEFQNIVRLLAQKHQIVMPEEELLLEANKWELSHGGLSGRTAQQFINYLLGQQ